MSNRITYEQAHQLFAYDSDTGLLTRKVARGRFGNRASAGSRPGTQCSHHGYRCIIIDGRMYKEHRIIWLMMTGSWPQQQIDHINRDRADNRWANLREATNAQNSHNMNTTKRPLATRGTSFYKPTGKWRARIRVNGTTKYLGTFDTQAEAVAAYTREAEASVGQFRPRIGS